MIRQTIPTLSVALALAATAVAQKAERPAAEAKPGPRGVVIEGNLTRVPGRPIPADVAKAAVKPADAPKAAKVEEAAKVKSVPAAKVQAAMPAVRLAPAVQVAPAGAAFEVRMGVRGVNNPGRPPDVLALALQPLQRLNPNAVDVTINQFMTQYRPVLRTEYDFLVAICRPDKDQRRAIARAGELSLRRYVEMITGRARQPANVVAMATARRTNVPRELFREALGQAARANLTPQVVAQYEREIEDRNQLRRESTIRSVVALLDQRLYLSPDQREKLAAKLQSDWKDMPEPETLQYFMNGNNQYFPMIQSPLVSGILDEDQLTVFNTVQKVNYGFSINDDGRGGFPLEDAELGEVVVVPDAPRGPANRAGILNRIQKVIIGE